MIRKLQLFWIFFLLIGPVLSFINDYNDGVFYYTIVATISSLIGVSLRPINIISLAKINQSDLEKRLRRQPNLKFNPLFSDSFLIFLSIVGTILLVYFVSQNVSNYSIQSIGVFSELYRNSNYKGSGIYTGISIYLMPVLVAGRLMYGIKNTSTLVGMLSVSFASLILGLRIFTILPIFAFILYELFLFKVGNIRVRQVFPITLLLSAILFLFIFTKYVISTGVTSQGTTNSFSLITVLTDIFTRIPYADWFINDPTINLDITSLPCLSIFYERITQLCSYEETSSYVKESIVKQVFYLKGGLYSGLPVPLPFVIYFSDKILFFVLNVIFISFVIPNIAANMLSSIFACSWLFRLGFLEIVLATIEDFFGSIGKFTLLFLFIFIPMFSIQVFQAKRKQKYFL